MAEQSCSPYGSQEAENFKRKRPALPMAHTCNPSYSGGRDQFEASLRQKVYETLSWGKKKNHNKKIGGAGRVASKYDYLNSNPSAAKGEKKRKRPRTGYTLQGHVPMTYFFQLGPTSCFPPPPINAIKL
jgi:hypothetical protein